MRRLRSWAYRFRTREQEEGRESTLASRPDEPESASREMPGSTACSQETLTPSPFIVGAGRSGTTLLRLMLDAHPDLAIPPETHFLPDVARACERAPNARRSFVETVVSSRTWEDYGLREDLLTQKIAGIEPFDLSEAVRTFYNLYAEGVG